MPLSAFLALPRDLIRRLSGETDTAPWIVPAAVGPLERSMKPEGSVFEFGAGHSTAWLAARSASLISLEHDPRWRAEVVRRLRRSGLNNCEVTLADPDCFPTAVERFPDEAFDLVVVDGLDTRATTRADCIASAASKVKPGGQLLLDDSDDARYARVDALLTGWTVRRFTGMKSRPLVATETSIYRRPPA